MSETNGQKGFHPQFERRSLQLAAEFGTCAETFDELPGQYQEFFLIIGYVRVCSLLVISDLGKGRSERQLATKYGLSRAQIERIKENSRLCKRRKDQ
jgi:hypothetical protein